MYDVGRAASPPKALAAERRGKRSGGDNRLTSVGGVSYTWSNNGNLLIDGVSTYTYSHANRLATAVEGGRHTRSPTTAKETG